MNIYYLISSFVFLIVILINTVPGEAEPVFGASHSASCIRRKNKNREERQHKTVAKTNSTNSDDPSLASTSTRTSIGTGTSSSTGTGTSSIGTGTLSTGTGTSTGTVTSTGTIRKHSANGQRKNKEAKRCKTDSSLSEKDNSCAPETSRTTLSNEKPEPAVNTMPKDESNSKKAKKRKSKPNSCDLL